MAPNVLIPAETALSIVLDGVRPLPPIDTPLVHCADRVLASDVKALRTQPPFDASAMDGYAVRQSDIQNLPATLRVAGTSRAGVPFSGRVETGETVRIFTGAVVPAGLDSIVIQENTKSAGDDQVSILEPVVAGKFIRPAGLDFKTGETLLKAGDIINPNRIALAASMNHATLPVIAKPKVALIATGDELVAPGNELNEGQIIASNTYGLAAGINQHRADVLDLGIVTDDKSALASAFETAITQGSDLIVTTGGASVGDHDLILPIAQAIGFDIQITKIAMRPGKPFIFGRLVRENKTIYLTGLAGNPVSSLVAFNVFVVPLLAAMSGRSTKATTRRNALLGCDLPENDERAEYMRGTLSRSETGELVATPFTRQDSSMLANLVKADCLIYRAVRAPAAKSGESCEYIPI